MLHAQGPATAIPTQANRIPEEDEAWSLDDIKDVFEAVHFAAITIGIAVGVWWFMTRFLRRASVSRIELETRLVGADPSRQILVVSATIVNHGTTSVGLRRCTFSIAEVSESMDSLRPSQLLPGTGLTPLFEGEFAGAPPRIDAGAEIQLTAFVAFPGSLRESLLTVRMEADSAADSRDAVRYLARD
jgi:hypothetical protein